MLKIGLTGGIGSGKSTVAKIFETIGIPVFYADDAAKHLMNTDENLKAEIQKLFGADVYENNQLATEKLSAAIFGNIEKLNALNALVHPATIAFGKKWMAAQNTPYAIKEAAILFESGSHKELDYVIGVYAPYELRLQRAMQRDNATAEKIKARMAKQMDEEEKMKRSDFVVYNDGSKPLIEQVVQLDKIIREKIGGKKFDH